MATHRAGERATMQPFGDLTPFGRVREELASLGTPVAEVETVRIASATGRTLAEPVSASADIPGADRAAMDGFALRADTTPEDAELRRVGRVAAGEQARDHVGAGECVEIATGAPLPPGADSVVPVERTELDGNLVRVRGSVSTGQHVSLRGSDLQRGEAVAPVGTQLHPSLISACAAIGIESVAVWRRLQVAVIPTGDEVVPLGAGPLLPGQVFDSNAAALEALFASRGCEVLRVPAVTDRPEALAEVLRSSSADVLITIGGSSVGRRDLVTDVVHDIGNVVLHGAAARPGKPLMLATVNDRVLLGLPGFPASCLTMAYVAALPLLARLAHADHRVPTVSARLAIEARSPTGKTHFLPVRLDGEEATPTFSFSSAVTSMARADGWIEIAHDVEVVPAGTPVEVALY